MATKTKDPKLSPASGPVAKLIEKGSKAGKQASRALTVPIAVGRNVSITHCASVTIICGTGQPTGALPPPSTISSNEPTKKRKNKKKKRGKKSKKPTQEGMETTAGTEPIETVPSPTATT